MQPEDFANPNFMTPSPVAAEALRRTALYGVPEEVAPGIVRVLAGNARDYTGAGTNTYVVGGESVVIIDPGPDQPTHVAAVIAAVAGRPVSAILVTHTHLDHSPAARTLKAQTGAQTYGFGALSPDILALTDEDVDPDFVPDQRLADGHCVGDGPWRMTALHTPGHFPNHLCYMLAHQGVLFSGDHVMGWSTTVVVPPLGNLADYMTSLGRLEAEGARLMLPSHGPEVQDPAKRIRAVRDHRLMRHEQILACLKRGIHEPAAIVTAIYDGLTPRLIEAAEGCVRAHLEVIDDGAEAVDTVERAGISLQF